MQHSPALTPAEAEYYRAREVLKAALGRHDVRAIEQAVATFRAALLAIKREMSTQVDKGPGHACA